MSMWEIGLVLGMAAVTFAVRWPVLALVSRIDLPRPLLDALQFIPPAVLTAIIAPAVLMPDGESLDLSPDNSYLAAGLVAALVAWRSKNLLLTLVVGMGALLLWRWVF